MPTVNLELTQRLVEPLTRREREMLALLVEGLSRPEIAARLQVGLASVKTHLHHLYGKLGVRTKRQALNRAQALGLLNPNAPAAEGPLNNLPVQTTPFVGRERELAALADYLADPHVRLVTILGLGGMGKTRLALAAAAAHVPDGEAARLFAQGVAFVGLARLETPEQLVPAIAEALNLSFAPGLEPKTQLLNYLRPMALLLVLDNFEHLNRGSGLVDELLSAAAGLKILVTSREKLNLQAEQLFPLLGLALPPSDGDLEPLASYSAIELFCERARRARPEFELTAANQQPVAAICRLVQGMPLGVVLAAAWLETHSPQAIEAEIHADLDFLASEMADMPERQRSLRAAFNHTWRLLPEQERTVFQRLSTFRGGFTRQAAEVVAGASRRDLQGLVTKSLLALSAEGRFDVHELLRQFAAEQLAAAPEQEAAVRDRHSAYYCNFISEHTNNWHNAQQFATLNAVTLEADNVQRAWQWAVERADWPRLEPALNSWVCYFEWSGRYAECRAIYATIVSRAANMGAGEPGASPYFYLAWAKALTGHVAFMLDSGDAQRLLRQSLSLFERPELAQLDVRQDKAYALRVYAFCGSGSGSDRPTLRQYLEQSLALYRDYGDPWGIAVGLNHLAKHDWTTGHYARALAQIEAALALLQATGDLIEQKNNLTITAWIYMHLGRLEKALQLRWEVLELCQRSGYRSGLVDATVSLSLTLFWLGRFDDAREWADQGLALVQEMGNTNWEGYPRRALRWAQIFSGQYLVARQEERQLIAMHVTVSTYGEEHWAWGCLALAEGDYVEARAKFAEGRRLAEAAIVSEVHNLIGIMLAGPGYAACGEGQSAIARPHFVEALKYALDVQDYPTLVLALPGVALWLTLTGQIARAVEVWELALGQPFVGNSQWFADVVGQRVETAALALTPAARAAARKRGRALNLWGTAAALVVELEHFEIVPAMVLVDDEQDR